MSEIFQAIILGIIQGLGEFLPISSSAHLIIVPSLMEWQYLGKGFDVALHAGTLIAIVLYFNQEVKELTQGTFQLLIKPSSRHQEGPSRLAFQIALASIPAAVIGITFEDAIDRLSENSSLIIPVTALMLVSWGLLMLYSDQKGEDNDRNIYQLTNLQALAIGAFQALALIPGASRSGTTITCGLFTGLSRFEAARFSFLLSLPVVLGATLLKSLSVIPTLMEQGELMTTFIVGIITSFISGLLCIKFFLNYLKKANLTIFVIYRIILATVLLIWFF